MAGCHLLTSRARTQPCDPYFLFTITLFSSSLSLGPYTIRFSIRSSSDAIRLSHSGSNANCWVLKLTEIFDCYYT